MTRIKTGCAVLAFIVIGAQDANAQAVFRAFIGPTQVTCEDFDGTGNKAMVGGMSIGKHGGSHVDFGVGVITNLCAFKPDRLLVDIGMNLFPVVFQGGRWRFGIGVHGDWDIPEMERSFEGEGSGEAYLFLRPEFVFSRRWATGQTRTDDQGNRYTSAATGFDVRVGRYRYSGNYLSLGLVIVIN